jgi:hypothetical protein
MIVANDLRGIWGLPWHGFTTLARLTGARGSLGSSDGTTNASIVTLIAAPARRGHAFAANRVRTAFAD